EDTSSLATSTSTSDKETSLRKVISPSFHEAVFGHCDFQNKSKKEIKNRITLPFLVSLASIRSQLQGENLLSHFRSLCKEYKADFSENISSYVEPSEKVPFIAAFLGGLLAQEVVKVLQHNQSPRLNFIVYSTTNIPCYVYTLGPTLQEFEKEKPEVCDLD
ncbi:hypothetical protein HMI54_000460, partial [Coelomomyces lativittatus]